MVTFKVVLPVRSEDTVRALGRVAQRAVLGSLLSITIWAEAPTAGRVEVVISWEESFPPLAAGVTFLKRLWFLLQQLSATGRLTLGEGTVQAWMVPAPKPAKASEPSRGAGL